VHRYDQRDANTPDLFFATALGRLRTNTAGSPHCDTVRGRDRLGLWLDVMSYWRTVSLVETTRVKCIAWRKWNSNWRVQRALFRRLLDAFVGLVMYFMFRLRIKRFGADLRLTFARPIIPLDCTFNLLASSNTITIIGGRRSLLVVEDLALSR